MPMNWVLDNHYFYCDLDISSARVAVRAVVLLEWGVDWPAYGSVLPSCSARDAAADLFRYGPSLAVVGVLYS